MKEELLLSGFLEPTNEPYAIAKISGIKMCENYFKQYGCNFLSAMPTNLYGIKDNFDLENSHVLPALMRKFHEAKLSNAEKVEIWGSGSPMREFLIVDDLADACLFIIKNLGASELYSQNISHINIGSGEEISILDLAKMLKEITGFGGELVFNSDQPDGMPKLLDSSRINQKGWTSSVTLMDGIKSTYEWFKSNF